MIMMMMKMTSPSSKFNSLILKYDFKYRTHPLNLMRFYIIIINFVKNLNLYRRIYMNTKSKSTANYIEHRILMITPYFNDRFWTHDGMC